MTLGTAHSVALSVWASVAFLSFLSVNWEDWCNDLYWKIPLDLAWDFWDFLTLTDYIY